MSQSNARTSPRTNALARPAKGFTLVELLVVIGIIALLISILLPSLNKARASAKSVQCKALMRQWAMAAMMYVNENRDVMPASQKVFDYNGGLLRYIAPAGSIEKFSRCPSDEEQQLATLGNFTYTGVDEAGNAWTPDFKQYTKAGVAYNPRVSIGVNVNAFSSQSIIPRTGNVIKTRWLRPRTLKASGDLDVTKIMTFGDYQNDPQANDSASPQHPVVRPGLGRDTFPTSGDATRMGTIVFRHNKTVNAAFLDGHVGTLRHRILMNPAGTQLVAGQSWQPTPEEWTTLGITSKPLASHSQLYYPFGPGFEGTRILIYGDYPYIRID